MNLALVAIVLAIVAGAVVAVSTRESAGAAIGLAVSLVAAALFFDPLPSAAVLGVRIVAALLAAALVRWAGRHGTRQLSALGWPGEALLATAAAVAGLGVAVGLASIGIGGGGPGGSGDEGAPAILQPASITAMALLVGAGCGLLVLGAAPLVHGRQSVRRAIGLVLVTQAVLLIRVGLAGAASDLEEVARAALLVTSAASGAALARAAAAAAAARRGDRDGDGDADADGDPISTTTARRPSTSA
ncbi:MAG: hypothetical protein HYX55_00320 [Chloroflexi bacterium]|nr:hypothetical protein [Chloroflexota bacterium]